MQGKEYEVQSTQILDLAGNSKCSAYNCEFVALAQRLGIKLVTSDREVLREFPATAVAMDIFAS